MGIQHEKLNIPHWNYFLALEEDVIRLSRFVEFAKENFNTYSMELARILFAASSEVDVVSKLLCTQLDSNSKATNIRLYKEELTKHFPLFHEAQVSVPRFGLTLSPWSNWEKGESPSWWRAYNNVKHERNEYFPEANLKNTLNAVAGLLVLLIHFYKTEAEKGKLGPNPRLFLAGNPFVMQILQWGAEKNYVYIQANSD
ncbi:MAG: hypothetical protein PVG66_06170 [Chromatiales bacterium]|jgi:hypothetical protein